MIVEKSEIIKAIKKKKGLETISDIMVLEMLENCIKKGNIDLKNLKKSDLKIIIKEIRSKLRIHAGMFQKSWKEREALLEKNDFSMTKTAEILGITRRQW